MQTKQTLFLIQQEKPVAMCSDPNVSLSILIDDIDQLFLRSDLLLQTYPIRFKASFINHISYTTIIGSKP